MTRLIDADALKKAIAKFQQEENERLHNPLWSSIGLNALNRIIDNAPTVPLPDFKDGYKQAIRDGKTNYSRPKGEWQECINEKWGGTTIYCPYCKEEALENSRYIVSRQVKSNFCPNCGAQMEEADNDTN